MYCAPVMSAARTFAMFVAECTVADYFRLHCMSNCPTLSYMNVVNYPAIQ